MTYYSVLEVTPTKDEWIPDYVPVASNLVAKYGGKYLARTAIHHQLEGNSERPALRVIVEWPSKEAALSFMKDPEYLPHFQARTSGSISNHFLIQGKDYMAV